MTKKKIVQTRVSEELYDKISKSARNNRVTVSNLVRNIVEDVLDIQEDVVDAIDSKVRKTIFGDKDAEVLGYQTLTLSKTYSCDYCEKLMKKGNELFEISFEDSRRKDFVCSSCKKKATENKKG